jgi:predicted ribosomally synthesized peptide with SipW-like signal peptide
MKSRMLVSLLVIALAAAVIGGATMAWFTDEDESVM